MPGRFRACFFDVQKEDPLGGPTDIERSSAGKAAQIRGLENEMGRKGEGNTKLTGKLAEVGQKESGYLGIIIFDIF